LSGTTLHPLGSAVMNDTPSARDRLRQEFLQQAAVAFDLMFPDTPEDQQLPFDPREQRAVDLGQDLAAWLLRRHAAAHPSADPPADSSPLCPHCQQPGRRLTPAGASLPRRRLTTTAGEITLARARFRCPACRRVFFPPG
jgi:hypothetical protein